MGPGFVSDPVSDLRRYRGVRAWWSAHGFAEHPAAVGKSVALALLEQPAVEDKRAGIFVLHALLGAQLRAGDLVAFARLFATGHLAEQAIVDRFTHKVLGALLAREPGRRDVVRALVSWKLAESPWQRRAACLAFAAAQGDVVAEVIDGALTLYAATVWSIDRIDQTAIGVALRELSRAEPSRIEAFIRRHALLMSRECARLAVARLPRALRVELLAHHRRVTSLQ